jgi:plastocyanin
MLSLALALLLNAAGVSAGEIEATVSDAAGKPAKDAIVFVYEVPGKTFPPPTESAAMDQVDLEFVPHVLPVLAGTKVRFPNKDKTHHHIYSFSKAKKFELPLYKGEEAAPVVMDKAGVVKLGCNIHDWMLGYILVLDNPYFARTGADGKATIAGVPAGEYQVAVWSERYKGEVEDTRQKIAVHEKGAAARFTVKLGPPRKSSRPAVISY